MKSISKEIASTPDVQLFILSRDRLSFCRETISSAVSQSYKNLQIIVSDNSNRDDVAEMLAREFPDVIVIRRKPELKALEHFNRLIDEATAPLMVLFHDDDVLDPEYISSMVASINLNPEIAALGCNARIIHGDKQTQQLFMGDFHNPRLLRQPSDLFEPYLSLSLTSPAPFPGYMYRTNFIKGLRLEYYNGGKHADASFLMSILDRGPILWINRPLFSYRLHGNNDSNLELIPDRLRLLRYVYSNTNVTSNSRNVMDYKYMYWLRWLRQNINIYSPYGISKIFYSQRHKTALLFVIKRTLVISLSRIDFWLRILRVLKKIIIK